MARPPRDPSLLSWPGGRGGEGGPPLLGLDACRPNGWLLVSGWVTSIDAHSQRRRHFGPAANVAQHFFLLSRPPPICTKVLGCVTSVNRQDWLLYCISGCSRRASLVSGSGSLASYGLAVQLLHSVCVAWPLQALSSAASSGILLRTGSLLLRECGQGNIPLSEVVSGRSSLLVCLFVRDGCQRRVVSG